jgi:hypothetical protein
MAAGDTTVGSSPRLQCSPGGVVRSLKLGPQRDLREAFILLAGRRSILDEGK